MTIPLKERLKKAASLVGTIPSSCTTVKQLERCAGRIVVSDVGCDHAYLSCYLVLSGACQAVVASDIRRGPLEAARQNVIRFGCEDRIQTVLTDGLVGIEAYHPTDIVICGMGGETIMAILTDASFIRQKGMRLILQPMTAIAELALFLAANGFRIYYERYALEGKKAYRILAAIYDGIPHELTLTEALVGSLCDSEDAKAYSAYCEKTAGIIRKKGQGQGNGNPFLSALYEDVLQKAAMYPVTERNE